jgi:mannose-6-phosphate isomerase-like protein (cupin superfamily)
VTKHPKDMSPEEREAFHANAEAQMLAYKYATPEPNGRPKQNTWFVRKPKMQVLVQCVRNGGENNLHYHTKSETNWFVLRGRAHFYGIGDKLLADLGPNEGVYLPGGVRYRFNKVGDEDLEILQVVAVEDDGAGESERINLEAHKEWMVEGHLTKY